MRALSIADVMARLQCSRDFVSREIHTGALRATRLGRVYRVLPEWLDDYLIANSVPHITPIKIHDLRAISKRRRA